MPPQHGAWAYLLLPLLLGLTISGWTLLGGLVGVAWVLAYPASYYAGRALAIRLRRGEWSRLARRERAAAAPWAIAAAGCGAAVVAARPWLLVLGVVLAALWLVGIRLTLAGRERGFGNDLLLVAQALVALPLVWLITADTTAVAQVPTTIWTATLVCAVYFVGSVIHVKSLIREAGDRRWRIANLAYHAAALTLGFVSPWLLVPFGAALARSVALRPPGAGPAGGRGAPRPGAIGAVEVLVTLLVLVFTLLAV